MSIISCTEHTCVYQNNGQCSFNSISDFSFSQRGTSLCIYYHEKEIVDKPACFNSENQEQT